VAHLPAPSSHTGPHASAPPQSLAGDFFPNRLPAPRTHVLAMPPLGIRQGLAWKVHAPKDSSPNRRPPSHSVTQPTPWLPAGIYHYRATGWSLRQHHCPATQTRGKRAMSPPKHIVSQAIPPCLPNQRASPAMLECQWSLPQRPTTPTHQTAPASHALPLSTACLLKALPSVCYTVAARQKFPQR
jgi:hypothetical protein